MPIEIVKKKAVAQEPIEKPEPVPAVPAGTRPDLKKSIKVGDFTILADMNMAGVGEVKFVVHLLKPYWFKVESVADDALSVKLKSPQGTVFDSTMSGALVRNYMVVTGPEGVEAPSDEVVASVRALIKPA